MDYKCLLVEVKDRAGIITMNRPDNMNALSDDMLHEINEALTQLDNDPEVLSIVITGTGKAFIAGADIKLMTEMTLAEIGKKHQLDVATYSKIENLSKPVIAAINGYCLGGGLELALGCDIRYASSKAKFGFPEPNLGVIAGAGGTQRLPRLVGTGKAKEMLFTGEVFNAEKAYQLGLVEDVVEPEELMNRVKKFTDRMTEISPVSVRYSKMCVNNAWKHNIEEGLLLDERLQYEVFASEDFKEGTTAFVEKRKPNFPGK